MIVTIINNDNTSKVLNYNDNLEFIKQCQKDSNHLLQAVRSLSPNFSTFTTKDVEGGRVVKTHVSVAEKLPKKIRTKNSSITSKELQEQFHKFFRDPTWKGLVGSLTIRSQHSLVKLN